MSSVPQNPDPQPSAAEERAPVRQARVVITAEEALTVPDSALMRPEKQLRVKPSAEPPVSANAMISMALGILGAPLVGILVGWFAIGFGALALHQIDGPQQLRGRGLAISGIALGAVDGVLWLVLIFIYGFSVFK